MERRTPITDGSEVAPGVSLEVTGMGRYDVKLAGERIGAVRAGTVGDFEAILAGLQEHPLGRHPQRADAVLAVLDAWRVRGYQRQGTPGTGLEVAGGGGFESAGSRCGVDGSCSAASKPFDAARPRRV